MLKVRGSNPGHSASKNPLLYPETLEVPIRGRVQLRILELGDEAEEKQKKINGVFMSPQNYLVQISFRFTKKIQKEKFISYFFLLLWLLQSSMKVLLPCMKKL